MKEFRERVLKASTKIAYRRTNISGVYDAVIDPASVEPTFLEVFNDLGNIKWMNRFSDNFDPDYQRIIENLKNDPETISRTEEREYLRISLIINKRGFVIYFSEGYREKAKKVFYSICMIALEEIFDEISGLFEKEEVEKEKGIGLLLTSPRGYSLKQVQMKKQDFRLGNYNSDLPHEKIKKELEESGSGLFIFHGKPGTGKTSYIRELVQQVNKNFIYLDPKTLGNMENDSLISVLSSYSNSIIVIEDCEKLIQARGADGRSGELNTLLNLTDGILGDSFNFKFICTFNSPVSTIDQAFLRNGRLKVIYEFKELAANRVKELADLIGKKDIPIMDMALCDVFNWEPGLELKRNSGRRTIGFNA